MSEDIEGDRGKRLTAAGIAIVGIGLLLLAILMVVLIILFTAPATTGFDGADLVGAPMPRYELFDYRQAVHTEEELKGAPAIIVFWQAGDEYCERLLLDVEAVYRAYAASGLKAVAIEIQARSTLALPFLARHDLTYLFLEGIFKRAVDEWRIEGVPSTFLVDRDGIVRRYFAGHDKGSRARLDAAVRELTGTTASEEVQ